MARSARLDLSEHPVESSLVGKHTRMDGAVAPRSGPGTRSGRCSALVCVSQTKKPCKEASLSLDPQRSIRVMNGHWKLQQPFDVNEDLVSGAV